MTDIERVRRILGWIDRGVAVSKIGTLLARVAPLQTLSHIIPKDLVLADYAQWQQRIRVAVGAFDDGQLEQVYGQVFSSYSLPVVFQDILVPVWRQLLQCQDQFGGASEWIFLDGFLSSRVLQRLLLMRDTRPRRVVISALVGHCRELELLIAALFLGGTQTGIRVLPIGQPFDELTLVCEQTKPLALVLFSNHVPAPELPRRLNRLAMSLECRLLLAGDASDMAQESLAGSSIGCLGNDGEVMSQRLKKFLAGTLDI